MQEINFKVLNAINYVLLYALFKFQLLRNHHHIFYGIDFWYLDFIWILHMIRVSGRVPDCGQDIKGYQWTQVRRVSVINTGVLNMALKVFWPIISNISQINFRYLMH